METSLARSIEHLLKCDLKSDVDREAKIESIITLGDITLNGEYQNSSQFSKIIPLCIVSLLRMMQDKDMNVWSLAEQTLVKVIKTYKTDYQRSIMIEIWNSIRGHERSSKGVRNVNIKMEGRSRRFALEVFSIFASTFKPTKLSKFILSLITILSDIVSNKEDQLLQETLAKHFEPIVIHHLSYSTIDELNPLIRNLVENVTSESSRVRRAVVSCLITLCKHNIYHKQLITNTAIDLFQLLFRAQDEKVENDQSVFESKKFDTIPIDLINFDYIPTTTTQGVLHGLKQLIITSKSFSKQENPLSINNIKLFLDLGIKSLSVKNDNNIFVIGLELIKEILFWNIIYKDMENIGIYGKLENLIEFCFHQLFDEKTQASIIVLIISCFCALLKYSPSMILNYIRENYQSFLNLTNHYDPMIKSQSYLFISYLIICKLRNKSIETDYINIHILLEMLIHSIQEESSSIASKLSCEGLMMLMDPLLASEYAHEVINIIYQLLIVTNNNVKGEILSLISSIDYKILTYIETTINNKNINISAPKLGPIKYLKDYVVEYIIQHISSNDVRLREIASSSLVKMIRNMKNDIYLSDKEFEAIKHCREEVYSKHEDKESNYETELQKILHYLLPKLNNTTDMNFLKGFYFFLKELGKEGYQIPTLLADILADHLRSNILIEDFEVQLDVALILTNILKSSKEFTEDYSMSVFLYLFKILKILHKVMTMQSKSYLKKLKKKYSLYSHIVERISDAHSLSLTSYSRTSFDDICIVLLRAIANIIPYVNKNIIKYIDRILIYASIHLKNYCDIVVNLLLKLSNVTVKYDRKLIAKFESTFILCKNYYLSTLSNSDRTNLLYLLSHLIMKGININTVDENRLFLELNVLYFKKEIKRPALSHHLVASQLLYLISYMNKSRYVPKDLNGKECVNKAFNLSWEYEKSYESIKYIIELIKVESPTSSNNQLEYNFIKDVKFAIVQNLIERLPCFRSADLLLKSLSTMDEKEVIDIYPDIINKVFNILTQNNDGFKYGIKESKELFNTIDAIPFTFIKLSDVMEHLKSFSFEHSNWILNGSIILKLLTKYDANDLIKENDNINQFIFNILKNGIININKEEINYTRNLSFMMNMVKLLVMKLKDVLNFSYLSEAINTHIDEFAQKSLNSFYSIISKDLSNLSVLLNHNNLILSILDKSEENLWYSRILKYELISNLSEVLLNSNDNDNTILNPSLLPIFLDSSFNTYTFNVLRDVLSRQTEEFINLIRTLIENESMNYQLIQKCLHVILSMEPNKFILEILFDKFLSCQYISVIILCENYILKAIDSFDNDIIIDLIKKYISSLRHSFLQKLISKKRLELNISTNSRLESFKLLLQDFSNCLDMNTISRIVNNLVVSWLKSKNLNNSTSKLEIRTRDEVEETFKEMYLNVSDKKEDNHKFNKDLYNFDEEKDAPSMQSFSWTDTLNLINILSISFQRYSSKFIINGENNIKCLDLINLAIYGLQEIIKKHNINNPNISPMEGISIFNYIRDIFYYFEITYDHLKEVDTLKELVYCIYENMVFLDKKKFENLNSFDEILNFILERIREYCFNPGDDYNEEIITLRDSYYNMLFSFCQSSSSLEALVYPFQSDPINFDFNNDPVHVLEIFLSMINRIPPRYPETFEKIKSQIIMGIDPKLKIHKLATSEKIKTLSIRILTSLLLCVNPHPDTKFEYLTEYNEVKSLPFRIVDTTSLKDNFVYLWKGVNISFNLDELLDFMSPPLENYISGKTNEVELGKECLRSIVLLANYLSPNQRLLVFPIFMNIIESQKEIYSEDILMKSYALLGISKIFSLVYNMRSDIKEKIYTIIKSIHYHILNQNIRKYPPQSEEKSLVPMTRYVIILSLIYLSQANEFRRLIQKDLLLVSFLKCINGEEIEENIDPKNPQIKVLLLEASKNPTEIVKKLCLLCTKMIHKNE